MCICVAGGQERREERGEERREERALLPRTRKLYKKLSYRRGTARCVVSIEILPIATQQCKNYLYDKS